jgi:hypothetical protein
MSYTITTVSRRRFMVKTKSKQGQSTPAASQSAAADAGASKASEPELFIRAPYRRPLRSAPTPWWSNWLAITLVNALVVAVVGGLYVWANGADSDEGGYVPRRTIARSPTTTPPRSAPAPSAAPPAVAAARQVAAAPTVSDEIDRAVRDGNRKVVLPNNVAGNCSVGDSGVKDFSRCLAENGGRAQ